MNNIRIIYRYSEVEPSVFLLLYFRMLGVYITERYLDQKVNLYRQMFSLQDVNNQKYFMNPEPIVGDVDLILINRPDDYVRAGRYQTRNHILVATTDINIRAEDAGRTVWYNRGVNNAEGKLLSDLLLLIMRLGIINKNEYDDCMAVAEIYVNCKFMQTTLSTKFFFIDKSHNRFEDNIKKYEDTVDHLLTTWNRLQDGRSGQEVFEHLWYAVMNTLYEADLYCKRSFCSYSYSVDNLLEMLQTSIKNNIIGTSLRNSAYMLLGQIYDDLVRNHDTAYEYYLKCCSNTDRHNAYVFMRKGQYWQEQAEQYETAIKYYMRSISIFPEYYRAWYRMGNAYYHLRNYREAYTSYDAVIRILTERLDAGQIRPMEIEHLFLAANQCSRICMDRNRDVGKAIELLCLAERVWNEIDQSKFIEMMSTEEGESQIFRSITKEKLNIGNVFERLGELYGLCGHREIAEEYRRKSIQVKKGKNDEQNDESRDSGT